MEKAYEAAEDEEGNEDAAESCLAVDVAVANGGAGDDQEVEWLPVADMVAVCITLPRIAHVFQLLGKQDWNKSIAPSGFALYCISNFIKIEK